MEWVATGRVFTAEEALAGGLVRSVHPADELLPAARALAREIADNAAPVSVALARRLMWTMLGAAHPMEAHRADSRAMFARGQSDGRARGRHGVPREARRRSSPTASATGCRSCPPGLAGAGVPLALQLHGDPLLRHVPGEVHGADREPGGRLAALLECSPERPAQGLRQLE